MFIVGISLCHYDSNFRSRHKLYLSIMKEFGFGQHVMETRILIEVEEMIKKLREQQGRACEVKQLTTSCVLNVLMSILFGHRFDHSDPAFKQFISDSDDFVNSFCPALMTFPILRFLPHFKKIMTKQMTSLENVLRFISNNIATCRQVCNCCRTIVIDKNTIWGTSLI